MKQYLIIFLLFLSTATQAGGFIFPNVTYSYAKLHFFNITLEQPSNMDFRIYKDGVYASSKLGNGILLSDTFHEKVQDVLVRGVDELIMGLGKCFMPRHGIIYYDKDHNPVASLSICFECDRISVWSNEPYHFSDDYQKFDYDKAEKQIGKLAKIIQNEGIPVYTSVTDEEKYRQIFTTDSIYKTYITAIITVDQEFNQIPAEITKETLSNWIYKKSKEKWRARPDSTGTINGETRILKHFKLFDKSSFYFEDAVLTYATISHPEILLPNGISVGMSAQEIYQRFGYEKPTGNYPSVMSMISDEWHVQLNFKYATLLKIEFRSK